jgi:malonate-semialdehyde dehydrogenase (acetylating)/methylmalonate-semialdehyde dehydrogenase
MPKELNHFIGGKVVAGKSGRFSDVYNPATGEVTARLPLANAAEVDAAVESAKAAFPKWAATPPLVRARAMFRYKEILEKNRDRLARLIGS